MKLSLPSPSLEPMLYFLSNSLAVIAVAAFVFFLLGLWFGYLTWGRYKRRARAFMEETNLLRHEIARLKRRIAEEAVALMSPMHEEDHRDVKPMPAVLNEPTVVAAPEEKIISDREIVAVSAGALPPVSEIVANAPLPMELIQPMALKSSKTELFPKPLPVSAPQLEFPALPQSSKPESVPNDLAARLFAAELTAGAVTIDMRVGIRYTERPDRWDDLTLLRGVAEITQHKLHDCGIFTFKQIAAWDERTSREIGLYTHTGERIVRERWVQQARDLHYLKYGEKLV